MHRQDRAGSLSRSPQEKARGRRGECRFAALIPRRNRHFALLEAARRSIDAAGHKLLITSEVVTAKAAAIFAASRQRTRNCPAPRSVCAIMPVCREASVEEIPVDQFKFVCVALDWHFAGIPQNQLVTRSRQFPGHMRADVQAAIENCSLRRSTSSAFMRSSATKHWRLQALWKQGRNAPHRLRRHSITTWISAKCSR